MADDKPKVLRGAVIHIEDGTELVKCLKDKYDVIITREMKTLILHCACRADCKVLRHPCPPGRK